MPATENFSDPVDSIPPPHVLREQIAEHVRRAELLRQLLRVSVRRERQACAPAPADEEGGNASR